MEDDTITLDDQDTKAANKDTKQPVPEDQDDDKADSQDEDSQPQPSDGGSDDADDKGAADDADADDDGAEELPQDEAEIKDWAAKAGVPLDDPTKVAKLLRDTQKKLHEQGRANSELRKRTVEQTVEESEDEELTEEQIATRRELNRLAVNNFYLENPEAFEYDDAMAKILKERPHLAGDFEAMLALAKAQSTETDKLAAKQAGKKEALAQASKAQRAGAPAMAATSTTPTKKKDPGLEAFDKEFEDA